MYLPQSTKANQGWQIIPELGLNSGYFHRDGYSEMNGFTYGDFSTTVVESLLGLRVCKNFVTKEGTNLNTQLRLTWKHNLSGSEIPVDRSWGDETRWYRTTLDKDRFAVEFSLSAQCRNNMYMALGYNKCFGDRFESCSGRLTLQWVF
jgi:outer membrane autotransporter protein